MGKSHYQTLVILVIGTFITTIIWNLTSFHEVEIKEEPKCPITSQKENTQTPTTFLACGDHLTENPPHYLFCDGKRKSVSLPHMNVTVHLFEFSLFENPLQDTIQLHVLSFVQDMDRRIDHKLGGAGIISNRTSNITFIGVIDGVEIPFRKRSPYPARGLMLEGNFKNKTDFIHHPQSIKMRLVMKTVSEIGVRKDEIILETCLQPPKKQYNTVSVLKPLYSENLTKEHIFEWIAHHLNVGVEHFIIYSRNKTYEPSWQPLIDSGIVTLKYYPEFGEFSRAVNDQEVVYTECVMQNRYNVKWMLLHDLDEFLITKVNLTTALSKLICEPVVYVIRSDHVSEEPAPGQFQIQKWLEVTGLLIRLLTSQRDWFEHWDVPKSIVQPRFLWWAGMHFMQVDGFYSFRYVTASARGRPVFEIHRSQMRWNHYRKMYYNRVGDYEIHELVRDESALYFVPYLNSTYGLVTECAKGNIQKCEKLKDLPIVFVK